MTSYYLLKYIEETNYGSYARLFPTKLAAIKAGIKDYAYDKEWPDTKGKTLEEKIQLFQKNGVYPKSACYEVGFGYFRIEKLKLED